MSRHHLANLEAVLVGGGAGLDSYADLPDLRNMSELQMQQLEQAIGGGVSEQPRMAAGGVAAAIADPLGGAGSPAGAAASHDEAVGGPSLDRAQLERNRMAFRPSYADLPPLIQEARAEFATETEDGGAPHTSWQVDEAEFEKLRIDAQDVLPEQECSICYQPVDKGAIALPCCKVGCGSIFHADCIRPWLTRNPSCPLCRSGMERLVIRNPPSFSELGTGCPLFDLWQAILLEENAAFMLVTNRLRERRNQAALPGGGRRLNHANRLQSRFVTASTLMELLERESGQSQHSATTDEAYDNAEDVMSEIQDLGPGERLVAGFGRMPRVTERVPPAAIAGWSASQLLRRPTVRVETAAAAAALEGRRRVLPGQNIRSPAHGPALGAPPMMMVPGPGYAQGAGSPSSHHHQQQHQQQQHHHHHRGGMGVGMAAHAGVQPAGVRAAAPEPPTSRHQHGGREGQVRHLGRSASLPYLL